VGEGRGGAGKRIPGIEEVRGVARDQQWHPWTVGGPEGGTKEEGDDASHEKDGRSNSPYLRTHPELFFSSGHLN
jgi:hypothetical protein